MDNVKNKRACRETKGKQKYTCCLGEKVNVRLKTTKGNHLKGSY